MRNEHRMDRRALIGTAVGLVGTASVAPFWTRLAEGRMTASDPSPSSSPGATPSASPAATPHAELTATIKMTTELRFDPDRLVVKRGTTVTWHNDSPLPHTATGNPDDNPVAAVNPEYVTLPDNAEPWGSELLQPGDSYSHTFDIPGEYHYICIPHVLSGMRGTITVEE